MPQLKYWDGSQWATALVGTQGISGTTGIQGTKGTQGIISSATAPSDTNVLWMDTIDTAVPAVSSFNPVFTGTLTLPVGTTSTAPLDFQPGSLNTTPITGTFEYDGNNFYSTPTVPAAGYGRALIPVTSIYSLSSSRSLSSVTTAQSIFGVGFIAAANTTYSFDMLISLTTSTTSHTVALSWVTTGTISSILYSAFISNSVAGVAEASADAMTSSSTTSTVLTAASTSGGRMLKITGIIRTGTQGTITPNLSFSAAPASPQNNINSYWTMTPIGSNTFTNTGGFA